MIFPIPQKAEYREGVYRLAENRGQSLYDFYCRVKDGAEGFSFTADPGYKEEEYSLLVDENGVHIVSAGETGKFRALTSVYQLAENGTVPFCDVRDFPQFSRRGYMMDISRCRMRTENTIKELIDLLVELKYNELQLYMQGECFKYSAYPAPTEGFDCLGPQEIIELVQYCRERFIDLVPNQNSFGHLLPWMQREEFRHLSLHDDKKFCGTLNPLLEESYTFVDGLYQSLLPYFDSEYVNIGLDEAVGLGQYQTEEYCREHGRDWLFMDWLNKLSDLAETKYGKKVMFWGDMITHAGALYHRIPKGAVALEWGYELIQNSMMAEHCELYEKAGVEYYVCPATNTHKSFTGRSDVTIYNIRTTAEIGARHGAKGLLLTDWGCVEGHPHFDVWSLVPIALSGQYGWNVGPEQNGENHKTDFLYGAEDFIDARFFNGAKASILMYRMANYYLLEPERVHLGTMAGLLFRYPVEMTTYYGFFELTKCGDAFYFDNVIEYVSKVLKDVEKLEIDSRLKREIVINAQMVILGEEFCKIRCGIQLDLPRIDELIVLTDWLRKEYRELWCMRNYERGVEDFENQLDDRRQDLLTLKASGGVFRKKA